MPTKLDPIPFAVISARCSTSTDPDAWAEVWCALHDVLRLERDALRVGRDCDALPGHDPFANHFGLHLWRSVERRHAEAGELRAELRRLQERNPAVYADAEAYARECGTRWVCVPDGSDADG